MRKSNLAVNGSKRNISLDVARVFALCCVMMIHSSSFFVAKSEPGSLGFISGNIFDSLSRVGVPIFVMISGALLLDENKQKSFKDMLRAAGNTVFLLVVWSVIYAVAFDLVSPLIHGENVSIVGFVKSVIAGQVHFWYLYMLIALYLATPFLRSFVKKENKDMVLFYIALSLMFVFFRPFISMLTGLNDKFDFANALLDKFHADFFSGFAAYYLTGWYVVHIGIKKSLRRLLYVTGAISAAGTVVLMHIFGDYENIYIDTNILTFTASVAVFTAINSIHFNKYPKSLALLSKLSFGMYIVHIMINKPAQFLLSGLNPVVHILLRFAIVFVLSFVISFVLSKIPTVKKIVRV